MNVAAIVRCQAAPVGAGPARDAVPLPLGALAGLVSAVFLTTDLAPNDALAHKRWREAFR